MGARSSVSACEQALQKCAELMVITRRSQMKLILLFIYLYLHRTHIACFGVILGGSEKKGEMNKRDIRGKKGMQLRKDDIK